MYSYIARRLAFGALTVIGVSIMVFVIMRILPGDPLVAIFGPEGFTKLTDKEFPVSPVFIDFLHRYFQELPFETSWHDQLSEELVSPQDDFQEKASSVAVQVLENPAGQQVIYRS